MAFSMLLLNLIKATCLHAPRVWPHSIHDSFSTISSRIGCFIFISKYLKVRGLSVQLFILYYCEKFCSMLCRSNFTTRHWVIKMWSWYPVKKWSTPVRTKNGWRAGVGSALLWEGWSNLVKDSQLVQKEAGSQPEWVLHNCLHQQYWDATSISKLLHVTRLLDTGTQLTHFL